MSLFCLLLANLRLRLWERRTREDYLGDQWRRMWNSR